ncbi:hypothetical protein BSL78_19490 [Apostichopus japonicus]|uniref:Uncharacterized protein n=1 Tax=Stichopus japonicus TaxID=307972 RepID=A0A2G8K6S1_STIJA|nr:hypothetical protein BSL78_19490 [Apostichopus japonicus]
MQPGREYLVKDNAIHPVDFKHTGLIEGNKKWGDGIQQFLEMKHSLALSPMTLITNFVSNVALFKKYNQIYGLSGTLGSTIDREFLEKIYGTPSFQIPTHKPNKMVDLGGVLKHSKEEWLLEICDTLKRECKLGNSQTSRAALVIAEDISTAKMLVSTIKSIPKANLKLYTRNETDEVKAIKESLQQCDVLVATNLAGRGTNIKVTDDVNQNGGLFVLVTFLPFNERVELQAKGRTSRKGEPGSSKMVILTQNLDKNLSSCHNFNQVLQLRDKEERRKMSFRISEINLVSMKDNLFQSYCKFVKHYISLNEKNNDAIQEEVEDLHEKWGFWLKHKSSEIERESQPDCKIWTDCLKKYLDEVKNEASKKQTPSGSIYNIIKLGNIKCFREEYECAKIYFTQAIERDKIWSSIAYYNRAFCTLSISKSDGMQEAINDLEKAKCLLQHYFNELTVTLTCIKHSRVTQEEDKSNEGHFLRQVQLKFQVLNYFTDKIEKLIKKIDNIAKHKADTEVHADDILSISSLFDDELCCDFLQELWQLGLTQIFHIEKSSRIILDQVIVISIGVAQGLVGALLIPVSSGMLSQIAVGLVCDGVSDILGGAFGIVHGREVKWKSWSINKGVTLAAICLLPCVMKYGKVAGEAFVANKGKVKLVKSVLTETSKTVISDAKCITNAKSVIQGTYQTVGQASNLILQKSGKLVAVEVTKQMVDECFTCVAQPVVMKEIANLLRKILGSFINNVMKDLFEGDEMKKLIIRIEISSKTTDFSGCSNFQKLGEDVLRRHLR